LGTRELLNYLEKLEISLSSFSYGELGTEEAVALKRSFEQFKHGLEDKVFGVDGKDRLQDLYHSLGIRGTGEGEVPDQNHGVVDFEILLDRLQGTPLNQEQIQIVKALKKLAQSPEGSKKPRARSNPKSSLATHIEYIEKDLGRENPQHSIGLKTVLEECMGQMELMEEVVRIFKQNLLEFIGCTKVQLDHGNFVALGLACQKLIPSLSMMKTHGLLETVQQMAIQCRKDMDRKHLEFLYRQFMEELPAIQEQVDFEMELLRTVQKTRS